MHRQCDKVADALAYAAKSLGSQIWVDTSPTCLYSWGLGSGDGWLNKFGTFIEKK